MVELSVHIITYNSEKHIEETLQSVLKQEVDFTYEIVIGDDCSTDNTWLVISNYAEKYPELIHIKKNEKQLGILKNFKATLDRCQGKYVFDLAGDDLLKTKDALQKLVNILQKDSSLGFVDSGFDSFIQADKNIKPYVNKPSIIANAEAYKQHVLLGKIVPVGVCYNKRAIYKFVDFDYYISNNITIEDYPILVDLIMHTNAAKINQVLHTYRVHDNSFSYNTSFNKIQALKTQMRNLFLYFKNKYELPNELQFAYDEQHYKSYLFMASYYEKKEIAKDTFSKIKQKGVFDYLYYLSALCPNYVTKLFLSYRKKHFLN